MDKILNKWVIAETDVNVDPGTGVLTESSELLA